MGFSNDGIRGFGMDKEQLSIAVQKVRKSVKRACADPAATVYANESVHAELGQHPEATLIAIGNKQQ